MLPGDDGSAKELLIHAGIDSSERMTLELLELAELHVSLHPPFVLHVTGRAARDTWAVINHHQVRILVSDVYYSSFCTMLISYNIISFYIEL